MKSPRHVAKIARLRVIERRMKHRHGHTADYFLAAPLPVRLHMRAWRQLPSRYLAARRVPT